MKKITSIIFALAFAVTCLAQISVSPTTSQALSERAGASVINTNRGKFIDLPSGTELTPGSSSRNASNVVNGVFNVIDYGATGNGRSNDLVAIQAAIDAAQAAGGGIVYAPPGIYQLSTNVVYPNLTNESHWNRLTIWSNNITIKGAGMGKTIFRSTNSVVAPQGDGNLNMIGCGRLGGLITNVALQDLTLDARGLDTDITQFEYTWDNYFDRVEFLNNIFQDAVDVQFGGPVYVRDCVTKNIYGNSVSSQNTRTEIINLSTSNNFGGVIENYDTFCLVKNSRFENFTLGTDTSSIGEIRFENCEFYPTNAIATNFLCGPLSAFVGCKFRNLTGSNGKFIVALNGKGLDVRNCEFWYKGIEVVTPSIFTVYDSIFQSPAVGVAVSGGTNVIITRNNFNGGGASAVRIEGETINNIIVSDNVFYFSKFYSDSAGTGRILSDNKFTGAGYAQIWTGNWEIANNTAVPGSYLLLQGGSQLVTGGKYDLITLSSSGTSKFNGVTIAQTNGTLNGNATFLYCMKTNATAFP